jgi:tetratricopeptide (TPR) repeat protein
MGRKRVWTGKYFYICFAILICLLLSQCAAIDRSPLLQSLLPQDEAWRHLVQAERLLAQDDYHAALEENQKALSLSPDGPPGGQALYNMGLIYAHPGNPKRDYAKSIAFLDRLIKEYPQSPQLEQAKVWVGVLRENEELRQELRRMTKVRAEQPQAESRQHLVLPERLLTQGDYEAALEENQKALSLSPGGPPGDEALYNMGLIYAHPGNPKRDYAKSIALFKRLIKEYAQSAYAERAKIWVQLIQESENAKRVAATLTQENDKLKRMIEESRKVDIQIEEKKKEQAR